MPHPMVLQQAIGVAIGAAGYAQVPNGKGHTHSYGTKQAPLPNSPPAVAKYYKQLHYSPCKQVYNEYKQQHLPQVVIKQPYIIIEEKHANGKSCYIYSNKCPVPQFKQPYYSIGEQKGANQVHTAHIKQAAYIGSAGMHGHAAGAQPNHEAA